ncbi:MAG: hypothetical protein ACREJU_04360 [Nitrospiraceae bacterium]
MINAFQQRPDPRGFRLQGFIWVAAIVLTHVLLFTTAWAESQVVQDQFNDNELATIVLAKDEGGDVQRKLGTPCVVPASDRQTVSYLYRTGEGNYLRFVVNVTTSDVHYQHVESMTMSLEPIVQAPCYKSSSGSMNNQVAELHTGKGITLGDSIEEIMRFYGEPNEKQVNGSQVRLRYDSGFATDQYYEWSLTFRDGRLVQWTAESIPFFIEVGG